jgi:hypothetical protein
MADYSDPLGLLFGGANYFGSPQKSQGLLQITPQEIERMAAAQSPAFGVFPQMQPYRSQQDIRASANVPVDVMRGRIAGTRGLFGDVVNQPIPMVRPLQLLSQALTGQQKYPDTEYYLDTMPLKSDTPVGNVAGRIGSFAPINPMPAVRGVQKLGGLLGEEMATRLNTGRPILPSLLAEPQTAMFAVNPAEQAMTSGLLQAEVSPLGFYSAVEQQALKIPRKQGTGESFLNDLLKGQDVKKYEIEAMGLDTYLKGKPNVTRQEVQDFIANNRVDVQERQLSGRGDKSGVFSEFNPDKNQFMVYGEDLSQTHAFNTAEEADNFVKQFNSQIPYGPSKYDKYQLAGGENYRELLLTLPDKKNQFPDFDQWITKRYGGEQVPENVRQAARKEYERQAEGLGISSGYQSSHFNEPNILAHMRVNDRVDAEGKKMLLIEEVQSDWHQAGREKGYNTPQAKAEIQTKIENLDTERKNLQTEQAQLEEMAKPFTSQGQDAPRDILDRWNSVSNRLNNLQREYAPLANQLSTGLAGVPDAPFKDTWYQLALKRAIKEAVDKGYDRIGLTTGKQQADRFGLSKQVDEIAVPMVDADGSRSVRIDPTEGTSIKLMVDSKGVVTGYGAGSTQFSGKKLDEVIGKEIAEKVMNAEANAKFSGFDLSVGGEGMKKYYDEIYPNFLNKYGKKYGAQVGETQITTDYARDASGIPAQRPSKETIRYLDITPEMRKAVQKGQPLAAVEGMTGLLA